MFVDWRVVNARFRAAMWLLAAVLTMVIIVSQLPAPPTNHHPTARVLAR